MTKWKKKNVQGRAKTNTLFPVAKVEEDRVGRSVQNFWDLKILALANYSGLPTRRWTTVKHTRILDYTFVISECRRN